MFAFEETCLYSSYYIVKHIFISICVKLVNSIRGCNIFVYITMNRKKVSWNETDLPLN